MTRLRWRLRGAWMWPTFLALTVADGLLTHWRPPAGNSVSTIGGGLLGLTLSLIAIVVLSPPLGMAIRRVRRGMPRVVARDYGGAAAVTLVTVALLAIGLAHRHTVTSDSEALQDATVRAVAYIGAHAPARYRSDLRTASVDPIQPPQVYRVCVDPAARVGAGGVASRQPYCVVVNRSRPFGLGVTYAGHESNALLELGTGA